MKHNDRTRLSDRMSVTINVPDDEDHFVEVEGLEGEPDASDE